MLLTFKDACELHPMDLDYSMSEQVENLSDAITATNATARGFFDKNYVTKGMETLLNQVLGRFYNVARKARWHGLNDVRRQYSSADQVGKVLIFDVLGGNYRLITTVDYPTQRLFVKALLTHQEYDRKGWLKWV